MGASVCGRLKLRGAKSPPDAGDRDACASPGAAQRVRAYADRCEGKPGAGPGKGCAGRNWVRHGPDYPPIPTLADQGIDKHLADPARAGAAHSHVAERSPRASTARKPGARARRGVAGRRAGGRW